MDQNRLKSPIAWTSLAALAYFVVKTWFGFKIPGWDEFVTLAVSTMVAFGIFNNPTNKEGF